MSNSLSLFSLEKFGESISKKFAANNFSFEDKKIILKDKYKSKETKSGKDETKKPDIVETFNALSENDKNLYYTYIIGNENDKSKIEVIYRKHTYTGCGALLVFLMFMCELPEKVGGSREATKANLAELLGVDDSTIQKMRNSEKFSPEQVAKVAITFGLDKYVTSKMLIRSARNDFDGTMENIYLNAKKISENKQYFNKAVKMLNKSKPGKNKNV